MDWAKIKIKAKIRLRFLKTKKLPLHLGYLGCPCKIDTFASMNMWDVRIRVYNCNAIAGETIVTEIAFLSPDVAEQHLKIGSKIVLWELGDFAEGEVIELLF